MCQSPMTYWLGAEHKQVWINQCEGFSKCVSHLCIPTVAQATPGRKVVPQNTRGRLGRLRRTMLLVDLGVKGNCSPSENTYFLISFK